jgi:hypothetical protein
VRRQNRKFPSLLESFKTVQLSEFKKIHDFKKKSRQPTAAVLNRFKRAGGGCHGKSTTSQTKSILGLFLTVCVALWLLNPSPHS